MKRCENVKVGMLLHAYELGLLEDKELEQFEVHLLECEYCRHELSAGEDTVLLLQKSTNVRAELQQTGGQEHSSIGVRESRQSTARHWTTSRWLSLALAATIALLLYPAYLGLQHISDNPFRQVQVMTLAPVRSQVVPVLHQSPGEWATVTFVYPRAGSGERYKVEIANAAGSVAFRDTAFGPFSDYSTAHLLLRVKEMPAGDYRLIVSDTHGSPALPEQQYLFRIAP